VRRAGRVHPNAERDRALAVARQPEGVLKVVDSLRIEP
jgi:hypothetical protein